MPKFDFAIRKRVALSCLKKREPKSPVEKTEHLFAALLGLPRPQDQCSRLVNAPIPHQIGLIPESGPQVNAYALMQGVERLFATTQVQIQKALMANPMSSIKGNGFNHV